MNCKTSLCRNTSKRNPGLTFFEGEVVGLPVVGVADGEELGLFVGFAVGVALGLSVGLDVTGLTEGDEVGATVGVELGDDVGLVLGLPVTGFSFGDEVGAFVGWKRRQI